MALFRQKVAIDWFMIGENIYSYTVNEWMGIS